MSSTAVALIGATTCTPARYERCYSKCPPKPPAPPPVPPGVEAIGHPSDDVPIYMLCRDSPDGPLFNGSNPRAIAGKSANVAVIAGSTVPTVVVAIVAIALILWYARKKRKSARSAAARVGYVANYVRPSMDGDVSSQAHAADEGAEVFYKVDRSASPLTNRAPDVITSAEVWPRLGGGNRSSISSDNPLIVPEVLVGGLGGPYGGPDLPPPYFRQVAAAAAADPAPRPAARPPRSSGSVQRQLSIAAAEGAYRERRRRRSPENPSGNEDENDDRPDGDWPMGGTLPALQRVESARLPRDGQSLTLAKNYERNWERFDEVASTLKRMRSHRPADADSGGELTLPPEDADDGTLGGRRRADGGAATLEDLGLPARNPMLQQYMLEAARDLDQPTHNTFLRDAGGGADRSPAPAARQRGYSHPEPNSGDDRRSSQESALPTGRDGTPTRRTPKATRGVMV